ncbi:hypothetical protein GS502_01340 [Rhodococcus hoagii]|nr:hypothetical protein [Prescottella equi]
MNGPLFIPAPATEVAIALVRDGLPDECDDVLVSDQVPDTRPPRLVRLSRLPGGGLAAAGATDVVRLLVECWAPDDGTAERLANVVRAVLVASRSRWAVGVFIRNWKEDGGPYSFPDASGQARWQQTGDLLLKVD